MRKYERLQLVFVFTSSPSFIRKDHIFVVVLNPDSSVASIKISRTRRGTSPMPYFIVYTL